LKPKQGELFFEHFKMFWDHINACDDYPCDPDLPEYEGFRVQCNDLAGEPNSPEGRECICINGWSRETEDGNCDINLSY